MSGVTPPELRLFCKAVKRKEPIVEAVKRREKLPDRQLPNKDRESRLGTVFDEYL